jgi:uncharacterized protein DUF5916/cellulose/xylan binding protein with CBM9 domain
MPTRCLLAALVAALLPPGLLAAQPVATIDSTAHTFTAIRAATAPAIDGRGTDPAWRDAPVTDAFRTFAPREGDTPTQRTEVRVIYDDQALYVLVRAFDSHPEAITRRLARRDTADPTADQILLFLDPYHDRRTGYEFIVTAGGVKLDGTLYDDAGEDQSWDGVWDVATRVDSLGWVAEFAIPFRQLRFSDRGAPVFGLLVGRWTGRTGERMSVPQYRRSLSGLASQLGTLGGLRDLARPGTVEALPYTLGRTRNLPGTLAADGRSETTASVGGDLKWLPRPNVTVDATFNPDFGQVDADPAVLNLTGVEVFQAERRPFFLEGAGVLNFPLAPSGPGALFYSRRIGRRPSLVDAFGAPDSPTETTILGAAKVNARLTPTTSLSLLATATQQEEGALRPAGGSYVVEPRAHAGVARLQQDFRAGRSGIGLMFTHLDRATGDSMVGALLPSSADVAAIVTQHQTADGFYRVNGWAAASAVRGSAPAIARLQLSPVHAFQTPDDGADLDPTRTALRGAAGLVTVGKVGGGVARYSATYRWIAPGFDVNDMGFLTTSGAQSLSADGGVALNRPGRLLGVRYRRSTATLGVSSAWSTSGLALARAATFTGTMQLANLAQLQGMLSQELPGAFCTVSCTRGGPALVDPPRTTLTLDYLGDGRRALVPHANLQLDRDDEGRTHGAAAQVDATWRVRSNLETSLAAFVSDYRYASQFYGRFGAAASDTAHYTVARLEQPTRSLTARVNYTMTTTLSMQWYAQAFVSRGAYADVRALADPRAKAWAARFRRYDDPAVTAAPGGIDFKQLRSNAVLRWEYARGSTLFVVWSQGRDLDAAEPSTPGLWPGRDFRDLFSLRPQNTIAVKVSYWFSR